MYKWTKINFKKIFTSQSWSLRSCSIQKISKHIDFNSNASLFFFIFLAPPSVLSSIGNSHLINSYELIQSCMIKVNKWIDNHRERSFDEYRLVLKVTFDECFRIWSEILIPIFLVHMLKFWQEKLFWGLFHEYGKITHIKIARQCW